jgi:hypothetical protein
VIADKPSLIETEKLKKTFTKLVRAGLTISAEQAEL